MYSFLKDIAHFRNSSNNNKKIQGPPYILARKERTFLQNVLLVSAKNSCQITAWVNGMI